jgi:hypothetical protein
MRRLFHIIALTVSLIAYPADAQDRQVYSLPQGAHPHDVAPAPDGDIWYTAQNQGALGILDPKTGEVRQLPLGEGSSPHGVIQGPDGAAWITDSGLNAIVRFDPATEEIKAWPLPQEAGDANLNTAAFDGDGVLWFTGQRGIYGRLDARTGERLWHFQTTPHDLWDRDNNAAPLLTTIRQNGREIDVVAQAGKTGFLYVFDRVTGEPIWPIEDRPVEPGDMPGEYYHPTQPFPTAPPPFVPQRFTLDDVNPYDNVTPEARAQFMERLQIALRGADHIDMYSPINFDWTLHIPGANGGALFGSTTAEPNTGMVYVIGQNNPTFMRLYPPEERRRSVGAGGGGVVAAFAE